jgi:hypothetical protein
VEEGGKPRTRMLELTWQVRQMGLIGLQTDVGQIRVGSIDN